MVTRMLRVAAVLSAAVVVSAQLLPSPDHDTRVSTGHSGAALKAAWAATAVRPVHYELRLSIRGSRGTLWRGPRPSMGPDYDGRVSIATRVVRRTTAIALHAASSLKISKYGITVFNEREGLIPIKDLKRVTEEDEEYLLIILEEELLEDSNITVDIVFDANFSSIDMRGFFTNVWNYINHSWEAEERVFFAMQFSLSYARTAFPCFDDPSAPAVFQVTIDVPPGFAVVGNSELLEIVRGSKVGVHLRTYVFKETVEMPVSHLSYIVYQNQ